MTVERYSYEEESFLSWSIANIGVPGPIELTKSYSALVNCISLPTLPFHFSNKDLLEVDDVRFLRGHTPFRLSYMGLIYGQLQEP
jgi:hypothetical protein